MKLGILALSMVALASGCGVAHASSGPMPGASPIRSASVVSAAKWIPSNVVATTAKQLIEGAKHSIQLEMYELGNPTLIARGVGFGHLGPD